MVDTPRRRVPNEDPGAAPDDAGLHVVRDSTPVRYDGDAERSMLSNILAHGLSVWNQIESLLRPEDFYVPNHGHIFSAMRTLAAAGTSPWPAVVIDQLRRDKLLETVGGRRTIDELQWTYEMGSYGAVADHARLIASYARSRRLLAYAAEMAEAAKRNDHVAALDVLRRASEEEATGEAAASWAPVDVGAVLDEGLEPLVPAYLARADGSCLLYAGKTHAFNAESESGKTWLALMACGERIDAGEHALYLDFEADARSVLARARQLGIGDEGLRERFHYVRPDDPFDLAARARLLELVGGHDPTLVVIDGVAEVMAMNQWNEKDNYEIAMFLNALPRLLERQGCAVVMIDHLVKDKGNQDRYARGGGHKLAGISGAAYKLEVVHRFAPGHSGLARVIVTKDRHGGVRALCGTSPKVAEFTLSNTAGEWDVRSELKAPDWTAGADPETKAGDADWRPTGLMEKVSRLLEITPEDQLPMSQSMIAKLVPSRPAWVIQGIRKLVDEGYVERSIGPRKALLHRSVKPYREALDVPAGVELEDPSEPEYEPF